jgi:hypothetical protein
MKPVPLDQIMKRVIVIKNLILELVGYLGRKQSQSPSHQALWLISATIDIIFMGFHIIHLENVLKLNAYPQNSAIILFTLFNGRYAFVRMSIPWIQS